MYYFCEFNFAWEKTMIIKRGRQREFLKASLRMYEWMLPEPGSSFLLLLACIALNRTCVCISWLKRFSNPITAYKYMPFGLRHTQWNKRPFIYHVCNDIFGRLLFPFMTLFAFEHPRASKATDRQCFLKRPFPAQFAGWLKRARERESRRSGERVKRPG